MLRADLNAEKKWSGLDLEICNTTFNFSKKPEVKEVFLYCWELDLISNYK